MSIFGKKKLAHPFRTIRGRKERINPDTRYLVKFWDSKGNYHKRNTTGSNLIYLKKKKGVKVYDWYRADGF